MIPFCGRYSSNKKIKVIFNESKLPPLMIHNPAKWPGFIESEIIAHDLGLVSQRTRNRNNCPFLIWAHTAGAKSLSRMFTQLAAHHFPFQ